MKNLFLPPPRYHSTVVLLFLSSHLFSFCRAKGAKRPAHEKISPTALCSQVAGNVLRSSRSCRKQLVVQAVGTKELAFHEMTATPLSTAQTTFVLAPLLERLFAVIFYGAGILLEVSFGGIL